MEEVEVHWGWVEGVLDAGWKEQGRRLRGSVSRCWMVSRWVGGGLAAVLARVCRGLWGGLTAVMAVESPTKRWLA